MVMWFQVLLMKLRNFKLVFLILPQSYVVGIQKNQLIDSLRRFFWPPEQMFKLAV